MAQRQDFPGHWAQPTHNGRGSFTPHYMTRWGGGTACGRRLTTSTSYTPFAGDRRCGTCVRIAAQAGA